MNRKASDFLGLQKNEVELEDFYDVCLLLYGNLYDIFPIFEFPDIVL